MRYTREDFIQTKFNLYNFHDSKNLPQQKRKLFNSSMLVKLSYKIPLLSKFLSVCHRIMIWKPAISWIHQNDMKLVIKPVSDVWQRPYVSFARILQEYRWQHSEPLFLNRITGMCKQAITKQRRKEIPMLWNRFKMGLLFGVFTLMTFQPLALMAEEGKVYHIGIIPTWPSVVTHKKWSPFTQRLSQTTGFTFRLKVYEKMRDFERDIISPEAPDFIFANALQTIVAHEIQGFVPLVRGGPAVKALIFVRQDSLIKTVDDLVGKRIAFVGEKNV